MQTAEIDDEQPAYRAVLAEAELTATMILHVVVIVVVTVSMFDHPRPLGLAAGIGAGLWSLLRLTHLRRSPVLIVGDVAAVQAFILLSAVSMAGSDLATNYARIVTIAGTSVISIGIAASTRYSLPALVLTFGSLAYGCEVIGSANPFLVFGVVLLPVQWVVAAAIRRLVYRATGVIDKVSADMIATRAAAQVESERRRYERDHLALLHDTAASTLLMVGQGIDLSEEVVARQAKRDIALLSKSPRLFGSDEADLMAMLSQLVDETRTPIRTRQHADPLISAGMAQAVNAAAREALTNIDRHSGAPSAVIDVYQDHVTITDRGRGFDVGSERTVSRHGVRNSIIRRMLDAGGLGMVTGTPGAGTTVTLSWPAPSGSAGPESGEAPERDLTTLVHGYTYGLIAAVVLLVGASVPYAISGPHPIIQAVLITTNLGFAVLAIADIRRHRRRPRITAVAVACLSVPIVAVILPRSDLLGALNWALGSVGYLVLIQLRHLRIRIAASAMVATWLLAVVCVAVRISDATTWLLLGYDTAGILVVQILAATFLGYLERAATDAASLNDRRLVLIAENSVQQALHRDHQQRYADLSATTMPLLQGLADGTLTPRDPSVQARALAESAHLRRLFQRDDHRVDAIELALRPVVAAAEARGVAVSLDVIRPLPTLDRRQQELLLHAPSEALASARTRARIVLSGTEREAEISVVADSAEAVDGELHDPAIAHVAVHHLDDLTWLVVRVSAVPSRKGVAAHEHSHV